MNNKSQNDGDLHVRIPQGWKDQLVELARKKSEKMGFQITLSNYVLFVLKKHLDEKSE